MSPSVSSSLTASARLVLRGAVFALVLIAGTRTASADDNPLAEPTESSALEHLKHGRTLYELGKWDDAIKQFEAGALREDRPIFLYNLGQSHRMAGRYDRARWYFDRFISRVQGVPGTEQYVTQAQQFIHDMDAAAKRPPTDVAPATPRDSPPAPWYRDVTGWALVGGGVIAIGGGGGFLFNASALDTDANREPNETRREQLYDQANTRRAIGWTALGVGAALTIGGAIKLAITPDSSRSEHRLTILFGPGSFTVTGRF